MENPSPPSNPLRECVAASPDPHETLAIVEEHMAASGDFTPITIYTMTAEMSRFVRYLRGEGIVIPQSVTESDVRGYVDAPFERRGGTWGDPAPATQCNRAEAVRLYFRLARRLGLDCGDPTADLILPTRRGRSGTRPLNEDEELRCRPWTRRNPADTRVPAIWAIGQASGTMREIGAATVGDVDLANSRIWLHGHKQRIDRYGQLTEWGCEHLERRLSVIDDDPSTRLAVGGKGHRTGVSNYVGDVLIHAGIAANPEVVPSSLTRWQAAMLFDATGQIEEVARVLGVPSLDTAADLVGWDWQP